MFIGFSELIFIHFRCIPISSSQRIRLIDLPSVTDMSYMFNESS